MHPKKPVMLKKGRLENQGADKMLKTIPGKDSLIYHGRKSGYVLRSQRSLLTYFMDHLAHSIHTPYYFISFVCLYTI